MIRKISIKAKYLALGVFSMPILAACSLDDSNALGDYKRETIIVDSLDAQSKLLTKDQYSIDSVCSLVWPSDLQYYSISRLILKNSKAYVMVSSYETSIFVYDSNGNLLHKVVGKVDGNDDESIDIADFFVDDNGNIHTFNYYGQKIVVYDSEGKFLRKINTYREYPWSIGVTGNGKYLYSFMENTCGTALAICNKDGRIQKKLVPFGTNCSYMTGKKCFFQSGDRISHIPLVSDSIFVFKNDTLEKVVKVDFNGRFVMDVIPDAVTGEVEKDDTHRLAMFDGVSHIYDYQETDSLIYFEYDYKPFVGNNARLIRKSTNETYCGVRFEGLVQYPYLYLLDNKLVFIVCKDEVESIRREPRDTLMEEYNKSAPQVQALIDGKIKTPAIFYISLK